ncbi:MAG: AMP-binding protein [Thermoplasmatota archaeon]
MKDYESVYESSIQNPRRFWGSQSENIFWNKKWDKVLDASNPPFYRWFKGGKLNTCYNSVDRHVENGRGEKFALLYDSPVTGTVDRFTYLELKKRVSKIAGFLKELGVEKGDTVLIYMPMIPETLMSMLACARIGAIHSVVFGGFTVKALANRIDQLNPKVILSASCGIEIDKIIKYKSLLDKSIRTADINIDKCIIFQRKESKAKLKENRDYLWRDLEKNAKQVPCEFVDSTHPLYVLYTSGTTGQPKGVVRDNGGHAVSLYWSMKYIYDIGPKDVFWAATDIGWVAGHSYMVYGPLLRGATTVMYEGKPVGTPNPGSFWRVISDYNVKVLSTAPTAIRAIKKRDPKGEYFQKTLVSSLDSLFLAGERTDLNTYHWIKDLLEVPVIDHYWQTETGWPIVSNLRGMEHLEIKPGSVTKPMPGYDIEILDPDSGEKLPKGENGVIVIKCPLPPGCLISLWDNRDEFVKTYLKKYPGYYFTGDMGYIDEDGYLFVLGRVDNVLNVAGHRISAYCLEETIAKHPAVAECAVVGVSNELKGEIPIGFLVIKSDVEMNYNKIIDEVIQLVREEIGPFTSLKKAIIVKKLPRTQSGKILRRYLKKYLIE